MPSGLRIALVLVGFVLIFASEFVYIVDRRRRASTPPDRYEMFRVDAQAFGMRIAGAVLIFIGLIAWVVANHLGRS